MNDREKFYKKILSKKYENAKISLVSLTVQKYRPPFSVIKIEFDRDGVADTQWFLAKYKRKSKFLRPFDGSHIKDDLSRVILDEMKTMFGVEVATPRVYSCKKLTVYEMEIPMFYNCLQTSDEEFFIAGLCLLAKFHAASFAYKRTNLDAKLYDESNVIDLRADPFDDEFIDRIAKSIWRQLVEFRGIYWNTSLDDIKYVQVKNNLNALRANLNFDNRCKILINGDFTWRNLFVHSRLEKCSIVDFSRAAYQSPLFDVFEYVASLATPRDWQERLDVAKCQYNISLGAELAKLRIATNDALPKSEYEKTFDDLRPIMTVLFLLNSEWERESKIFTILTKINLNSFGDDVIELPITIHDSFNILRKFDPDSKLIFCKTRELPAGFTTRSHLMLVLRTDLSGVACARNFFVKTRHCRDATMQKFTSAIDYFAKETTFYDKYVSSLKRRDIDILDGAIPNCHHADPNKYLILDDMSKYGFESYESRGIRASEFMIDIIPVLARLHASCFVLEEKIERETGREYRLDQDLELNQVFYSMESYRNATRKRIEIVLNLLGADRIFQNLLLAMYDQQINYAKPHARFRNTICHGDLHASNMMMIKRNNSIKLIDFKSYFYAPPALDLMITIYLNSTPRERSIHAKNWIGLYYQHLMENLSEYEIAIDRIVARTEFDESCEYYEQSAAVHAFSRFQITYLPPNQNVHEFLLENRGDVIRELWTNDQIYRYKLTESLIDLRRLLDVRRRNCH